MSASHMGTIAIVCGHVAKQGFPILMAVRDEALGIEDSGWQFLCGVAENEDEADAEVWTLRHALEVEPALRDVLQHAAGTVLTRPSADAEWAISNQKAD